MKILLTCRLITASWSLLAHDNEYNFAFSVDQSEVREDLEVELHARQ